MHSLRLNNLNTRVCDLCFPFVCWGGCRVSVTAGTLEINGASIKARTLLNACPSGTKCNNNNRRASIRYNSQVHFSHQSEFYLHVNQKEIGSDIVVLQALIP